MRANYVSCDVNDDDFTPFGRFGPLEPDHPIVGTVCPMCEEQFEPGSIPSLRADAPIDDEERERKESGRPYNASATPVHQSCAYPDRQPSPSTIGARANEWRRSRPKPLSTDPAWIMNKITEEVGELAKALVGDYEGRPGRGDVRQEAAQCIIVIASLVDAHCDGADVMSDVDTELERLGA